jgi:uncharacterized membrane protein YhaH (DUF805 family)
MDWYLTVLKKYAVFNGRSQRAEYWYFVLFNMIVTFVLGFIERQVGVPGILSMLYGLGVLVPGLAVSIRRLHDTGKTGWWILIGLIPLVGFIVLLVFMVQDSQPNENQYGPSPKLITV